MKNIPLFTTENGVASLILEQIPFNKKAYIRIQSSAEPESLLQDCLKFCVAAGAEDIYSTGNFVPNVYDCAASIIRMVRKRCGLPKTDATLAVVNSKNISVFRTIYNEKMSAVPNASIMTIANETKLLADKNGYFVYWEDQLIGIGIADNDWIRAIVSLKRGCGETVLLALNQILEGDDVNVELIDSNLPALHLYQRLDFKPIETISTWYKIF